MTRLLRLLIGLAWFLVTTGLALGASSTAVEYFHRDYGHYFVTALAPEIAALDSGTLLGWSRTGQSFDVLALGAPSAANVCRFWTGQTFAPKSSHFYTPYDWECAIVKRNRDWVYEGEVFAMMLADSAGTCPGGTAPLYRLYNNGKTGAPNHRYTTSLAVRAEMVTQGWIPEGSGIGVIGCVPPGPPTSVNIDSPARELNLDDRMQLTAVARDAAGVVVPGAIAAWSISDPGLADVTPTGLLRARAIGTVTVRAMIGGVSDTLPVTIIPAIRVGVSVGPKEVVFRYATDRCDDWDSPDVPPRLIQAEDGSLVLFAGNGLRYFVSRGIDVGSLKRDCSQPVLVSPLRPTPESYENLETLWFIYREGNRWHALVNNEFHDPVASTCQPGNPYAGNPCWYNSITYAVSTDGAHSFAKPLAPAHVVAPPPYVWTPPSADTPTSVVFPGTYFEGYMGGDRILHTSDGYYFTNLFGITSKNDPANGRNCAIRTDRLDDPTSWRAWDGSGFNLPLTSPYVTGRPGPLCTSLWSALPSHYNTFLNRYMQVFQGSEMVDGKKVCGVYFALSADLFVWSPPQLIAETVGNSFWDTSCAADPQTPGVLDTVPLMYVSLIDHADTTVNFERPGRTPYLYYVRFNDGGADRQVVRVPLTFTRLD